MKAHETILVIATLLSFVTFASGLTWLQYYWARFKIRAYIRTQETSVPEPHLKLIPGLVRLAFHDCSGMNCDGCINASHPFNDRVVAVVKALEPLYCDEDVFGNSIRKMMSRADFWALGSIVATNMAIYINNARCIASRRKGCYTKPMRLPFRYGRKDCLTSPFYSIPITPELPSAFLNNSQTLDFFQRNFGFNARESAIIMGGHSLGFSAKTTNIPGTWERGNVDGFGNQYFKNIINENLNWNQAKILKEDGTPQWRWIGRNGVFAIPTDINLVRDISVNTSTGFSSDYYKCPRSITYDTVRKMTGANYFRKQYAKVFIKMISLGKFTLKRPSPFSWSKQLLSPSTTTTQIVVP